MNASSQVDQGPLPGLDGEAPCWPPSAKQTEAECGNASYDNGVSEDADWFGGGFAGDPDYMFAVRFDLADFGYQPGEVEIVAFCAANQIDFDGPWPNEVFILPDSGGLPDESVILGRGTIWTGDGSGPSEVWLTMPVTLNGDFWLVNRGDPIHAMEDFNMEFDGDANNGHSFFSNSGIAGLQPGVVGNYALRATLQLVSDECSYGISPTAASFGHEESVGSVDVYTDPDCDWSATSSETWITITSGETYTGGGTVEYSVTQNLGPARTGQLSIAGHSFTVTQAAPPPPADFSISVSEPEIGEFVTFSVDPLLEVVSWDFGGPNCWEDEQFVDCTTLAPGACNSMEWAYMAAGEKPVTMVLADDRMKIKSVMVRDAGECCSATGPPEAAFTMSTDRAMTGEMVVFTEASSKAERIHKLSAVSFSWSPDTPAAGEKTLFQISGCDGDIEAVWNFGGAPCGDYDNPFECSPIFTDCHDAAYSFATPGVKTVRLTVKQNGLTMGTATRTITVSNLGYCDDGICRYTLTPTSSTFPAEGGTGEFEVDTAPWCDWTASTDTPWLEIITESGAGASTVDYIVSENLQTVPRSGVIEVGDRVMTVSQCASAGNIEATAWRWTIVIDDMSLYSGTGSQISYVFTRPGTYSVTLVASNCLDSSSVTRTLEVVASPVDSFVIPSAVSLAGANDTLWESDFRFFNPCGEPLALSLEFEPEGTNNTDAELASEVFQLGADETLLFANIREAIPDIEEGRITGSVRIDSLSASGCRVISASRTFNDTPGGTLGLFVPSMPVTSHGRKVLDLTGLTHDVGYRTNLRLVNFDDEDTTVHLVVIDSNGDPVNDGRQVLVPGHSTRQIDAVAHWIGVSGDLPLFSVRVTVPTPGPVVEAFATVVDNITGDSVLNLSSYIKETTVWVVGVAHILGVNDSRWRTDLSIFNPTENVLRCGGDYVVGENPEECFDLGETCVGPKEVQRYLDIAGSVMEEAETRGYLILRGLDGAAPQIAARTYNLDDLGGTSGLNLRPYGNADLLYVGESGYIAGVSTTEDGQSGFRTNLGVLNTDEEDWSGLRITLYALDGSEAGGPLDLLIPPGVLLQFDIFKRLGLGDQSIAASIKVDVVLGGAVAVYASEIDNRSQDPIFIPAQKMAFGSAGE